MGRDGADPIGELGGDALVAFRDLVHQAAQATDAPSSSLASWAEAVTVDCGDRLSPTGRGRR
jgi:hypothetical protein